jgi:DNA-binding response OmpR family regulator
VNDASTANSGAPPLRVLLVEDYPDLAAATADFLEAEGLDVRTALSGHEALAIASTFQPQLLLCDMNLPDMSGLDVVRELRSSLSTQRTYVVILTAAQSLDVTRLQHVDLCMAKPITIEALPTLVKAARSKNTQNAGIT